MDTEEIIEWDTPWAHVVLDPKKGTTKSTPHIGPDGEPVAQPQPAPIKKKYRG